MVLCIGAGGRVTKGGQPRKKMIRRSGPKSSASEAVLGDGGTATVKRTSKKINYGMLVYCYTIYIHILTCTSYIYAYLYEYMFYVLH